MSISGSVGIGGRNDRADVRRVQGLLNENGAQPRLSPDGVCGRETERTIVWFQERIVRLKNPDGRIDPAGKTWRSLSTRSGQKPDVVAPRPSSPDPDERKEFRSERRKFVDPRVRETGATTKIIDSIFPHFRGTGAKVISGYLSDTDLFWKVNYHWEYLLWMVGHSLELTDDKKAVQRLHAVRGSLLNVAPNPDQGYRTSAALGKPVDTSTPQEMTKRHKVVSQQKQEFKGVTRDADLISKSPRPSTAFHLAAAPVAHPGTSKHSTGYALDISGSAGSIKSIAGRLGATLVFDEKSHVHVEFKNGVRG